MQCWTIVVKVFHPGSKTTINLKTLHGIRSEKNSISTQYKNSPNTV